MVNNLRDIETDVVAGKRTLAVRFGRKGAVFEYAGLLGAAYAVPLALFPTRGAWILLPLVSAPIAVWLMRRVATESGRALNATLARTAQLLLLFGGLFAAGIVISS